MFFILMIFKKVDTCGFELTFGAGHSKQADRGQFVLQVTIRTVHYNSGFLYFDVGANGFIFGPLNCVANLSQSFDNWHENKKQNMNCWLIN